MMMSTLFFTVMIVIGYLFGSVCSAIVVSRLFDLPDPRTEGSQNPGATNVLRLSGKRYAGIVLFADMLKGLIPVALGHLLGASETVLGFTCLAAVLGHMYPIFFRFNGGKGVATALGAFVGLNFLMGVSLIAIWLLIANFSRYSSLASIATIIIAPIISIVSLKNTNAFIPLLFMTFLILYKHRHNISRLIDGEEPKIYLSKHRLSDVTGEIIADADILDEEEKNPPPSQPKKATARKSAPKKPPLPAKKVAAKKTKPVAKASTKVAAAKRSPKKSS